MADDDDTDSLLDWDDFEQDDIDTFGLISANLRDACGFEKGAAVHAGEADEGQILWAPPTFSGLTNSEGFKDLPPPGAEEAPAAEEPPAAAVDVITEKTKQLWDELAETSDMPSNREAPQLSQSVIDALLAEVREAVEGLSKTPEKAVMTVDMMNRLAKHGTGECKLTLEEFKDVHTQLSADQHSKTILQAVKKRQRTRQASRQI
ncbi:hypothetical protein AB1Y20_020104 [Prymnesium parvum]|uniref:Uncharacterized protein n=1 Tax=Prymnesium parvum TaxID=97485 RepID=A0AB34JWF3_PRYPA